MPEHIMKRFYNLQLVDFNKRPQYIRAKLSRCTRANHFESRSQTEKTTSPGLYKRATSFRYSSFVENWLYICRHGWGRQFSLSARDSKWLVLMRRASFASVLWPFFNRPAGCRTFDTCSADCRLIATWNSYMGKTQSPSWFHNLLTGSGIAGA